VTEADEAVVPLDDGRWMRFSLVGPSDGAHERMAWTRMEVAFASAQVPPRAIYEGSILRLVGGPMELRLGVPDEAMLISTIEDCSALRVARLYSLVVNRQGEQYAEALIVHEVETKQHFTKQACAISVVGNIDATHCCRTQPLDLGNAEDGWLQLTCASDALGGSF
jgi:hypothetical protein